MKKQYNYLYCFIMGSCSSKIYKISDTLDLPEDIYAIIASYLSEMDWGNYYCRILAGNTGTKDYMIYTYYTDNSDITIFESRTNGLLHSFNDEPSEIIVDSYKGDIEYQYKWHSFGMLHRNFGLPSLIAINSDMDIECMFWYENGKQSYNKSDPYPNYIHFTRDAKMCRISFTDNRKHSNALIEYHNPKKLSPCMTRQDIFKDAKECYMTTDKSPNLLKNFYSGI